MIPLDNLPAGQIVPFDTCVHQWKFFTTMSNQINRKQGSASQDIDSLVSFKVIFMDHTVIEVTWYGFSKSNMATKEFGQQIYLPRPTGQREYGF